MNIGDLYAQSLLAASSAADLILISPDTYTGFTTSDSDRTTKGFTFQIVGEEAVDLQSDITDYYVDNNSTRQDHIAIRPAVVTVSGFVGELNNVIPDSLSTVKNVVDRLDALSYYTPEIVATARRAFNTTLQLLALKDKIIKAGKVALDIEVRTKQEQAFADLQELQLNRTLFYVATPFGQFSNMAIQSIRAVQSADSKSISDFVVTFKEMKFATTKVTSSKKTSSIISFSEPTNMGQV